MTFTVKLHRKAVKHLQALDKGNRQRIWRALDRLAIDPRPPDARKLQDSGSFRIRVGAYRVVYEIADAILVVYVINIDHRSRIYRSR